MEGKCFASLCFLFFPFGLIITVCRFSTKMMIRVLIMVAVTGVMLLGGQVPLVYAQPTTTDPTTVMATTADPSTALLTTADPSTALLTTADPSTALLTTAEPPTATAQQPSTTIPSTSSAPATALTTSVVTTAAPSAVTPCSNVSNCSSHASTVAFNASSSRCECTCSSPWAGALCDTCAAGYNASTYPLCSPNTNRSCVITDCGPWTKSVSGFTGGAGCNCTCLGQATNQCRTCPSKYDQSIPAACSFCAAGYNSTSYPFCYRLCSQANCSFRAKSGGVTGDTNSGCKCSCVNYYSQPNCSICPLQYDTTSQCSTCAVGYTGTPPDCKVACQNDWNCSGHATQVTGQASVSCTCTCLGGWTNSTCDVCPPNYDIASNCTACAVGFAGTNCTECSPATCNYRGTNIPTTSGCDCQCRNLYFDTTCSSCPEAYDPSQCIAGVCNDGMGYVLQQSTGNCVSMCNITTSCGGRSAQVFYVNTTNSCNCTSCLNKWNGTNCSTCPMPYNGTNCSICATGYVNYPICSPLKKHNRTNETHTHSYSFTSTKSLVLSLTPRNTRSHTIRVPRSRTPVETLTARLTPSAIVTQSPRLTLSQSSSFSKKPLRYHTRSTRSLSNTFPESFTKMDSNSLSYSSTRSKSQSLCANNISDCTMRSNHTEPDLPPVHCFCWCVNMWSEMFCNYCHPRYNESADCGTCNPGYVNYSKCDFAVFVSGNWSFALNASYMLYDLVRSTFFAALAADLNRFVLVTLNCTQSENTTAYVNQYYTGTSTVGFTVQILDPDPANAYSTAACVENGLMYNTSNFTLQNASALTRQLFPGLADANISLGNISVNSTVNASVPQAQLPCQGSVWCANAPPVVDIFSSSTNFTWIIIVAAVLVALLAAAGAYFLWFRPRAAFRQKYAVHDPDFRRCRDLSDMEVEWCNAQNSATAPQEMLQQSERSGSLMRRI